MHSLDPCGTPLLVKLELWENSQITVLGLLGGQRVLLSICWTASLVEELEDLLSGVCAVGKELLDQAAASGAEAWEGGELGGCPLFLKDVLQCG